MSKKHSPQEWQALQCWVQALEDRLAARQKTVTQVSPDQLTRWHRSISFPRNETLRSLLSETLDLKIWDDVGEVVDWMALLNITGHETLQFLLSGKAGEKTDEEIQADIETAINQNRWWRPLRNLPAEETGYIPRACEPQLIHALLNFNGFRQPEKRIVAVSAPTATGKTALLIRLIHSAELCERYRDGIYWISAADLTAPQAIRNLALATECITSLDEEDQLGFGAVQQRWQAWLSQPGRVALIVLDGLTEAALFEEVMRNAGPQVQSLVSVEHRHVLTDLLDLPAGQAGLVDFQLTGLDMSEVEQWLASHDMALDQARLTQLATYQEQINGRPDCMMVALARLARNEDLPALPPASPQSSETIARPSILRQVEAARDRQQPPRPIVLHGPPGSGKSTMLDWLTRDSAWRSRYPGGSRSLTPDDTDPTLIRWRDQAELLPTNALQLLERLQLPPGKPVMLCLDNWSAPELAWELSRALTPGSIMLIATRSSTVAAALGIEGHIEVGRYTPEEATAYFQQFCVQHQREITDTDRRHFETVRDLVRANPLDLRITLINWLWRDWTKIIEQLKSIPPEQSGQEDADLYQPLRMAYDFLGLGLRRAFRQLSSLPLLESYDRATFGALWSHLDPAYVDLYLDILATDAGLIEPTHEASCWKIHSSVLNYAYSLAAAQDEVEQRPEWINRALASVLHQTTYRHFRDRSPKWSVRRWIELDRTARLQYHESVWRRSWYVLRQPTYVPEWAVAQAFAPNFSAAEYLIAQRLQAEEIRTHRLIQAALLINIVVVLLGLLAIGLGEDNPWFAVDWLPRYAVLMTLIILLDIALLFYIWLVGMSHKVIWLQWWLEIQARRDTANAEGTPVTQAQTSSDVYI